MSTVINSSVRVSTYLKASMEVHSMLQHFLFGDRF
jgi:hypothetical protein